MPPYVEDNPFFDGTIESYDEFDEPYRDEEFDYEFPPPNIRGTFRGRPGWNRGPRFGPPGNFWGPRGPPRGRGHGPAFGMGPPRPPFSGNGDFEPPGKSRGFPGLISLHFASFSHFQLLNFKETPRNPPAYRH